MIAILPIQPDILEMMAGDIGLEAEGPVWGYFAAEGTKMLGYIVVEKAEPVRIIALQCEDFVIADGVFLSMFTMVSSGNSSVMIPLISSKCVYL